MYYLIHGDFCRDGVGKISLPTLCFTSPPYCKARTYGIKFDLEVDQWVDWCLPRFQLATKLVSVSRGLCAWVVGHGFRRDYKWNAAPYLLATKLAQVDPTELCLRDPVYYHRNGIPGSGGPDWLRQDVEMILCATGHRGRLGWSDNTACGHPPRYGPGGAPSHRTTDGSRVKAKAYKPPARSNPGNLISLGSVGGGKLGHDLAHENEAPFPEKLADFFIRSYCPPNSYVLDPFMGSGTTLAAAFKIGRNGIGFDIRESQIELTRRRLIDIGVKKKDIAIFKIVGALKGV